MKKLFPLLFLLCALNISAQENPQKHKLKLFDEFGISLNHTNVSDNNTSDKNGFGLKVLYNLRPEKKLEILLGAEYTHTHQFKRVRGVSLFSHLTDVDLYLASVGVPFFARYTLGENTKLFFEAGGFIELNVKARTVGTYHSYLPGDQPGTYVYSTGPYEERESIVPFSLGPSAAVGVKVKLPKNFVLLRAFYKQGLLAVSEPTVEDIYNSCFGIELGFGFK